MKLFINKPNQIYLIRGNHEGPSNLPCFPNDFKRKIYAQFKESASNYLYNVQTLFDNLLTGIIIEEKSLLVHGGIPTHGKSIEDIAYADKLHPSKPHLMEILWNDPMPEKGIKKSPRGVGYLFGPDITAKYLKNLGLRTIIRGHQATPKGLKVDHNQILTIFSSKNRNYNNKNRTALKIKQNHSFKIEWPNKGYNLFLTGKHYLLKS